MQHQELLENPEVQRIIVDSVPTMVLLLDEQGRIAKVNSYFEKKTGFAAQTIIGKDWFSTFLPDEDRPQIQALFAEVLKTGINSGHVNAVLTADGGRLEIEWFAKLITDPHGRARWLLNVGHDVTDRLKHEQALESAIQDAERANAAKSRFLTAASHDLRQPLQTLVVVSEGLARLADKPEQDKLLRVQRETLAGMRDLLNALLDIGKLESGAIEPDIGEVPIQDVFERIRAELEPLAVDKGLELLVEGSSLVARTDAALLTQLIQNVVGNAIRYTTKGSVQLTCKALEADIEISVADTGIGIREDHRELIFDEFYKIDRDDGKGGLGLGLSIVTRIAAMLDCQIALDSEFGRGTTFRLRVPAAAEGPVPKVRKRAATRSRARTGTVFLVDDDATVLWATQLLFELDGFKVIAAASPDDVAAELESASTPIDLIVTDYRLRDAHTGIDVINSVRQYFGRTIPAIVMTGDSSPLVGEHVARLEVLSKPIAPDQLLGTIQRLLEEQT